ncbi:sensor histidine kinase [Streptomyces sp. B15]|uniref:sensor histidine kinase n=1 Tax=Streptomyces sp. B15 TaxID=1537797 RepID=UPI001B394F30|nr:histidine kinase [Streptomyces sp. B15]MBQ1124292.1 hypothetical protein [Streptomyces sp. B15]
MSDRRLIGIRVLSGLLVCGLVAAGAASAPTTGVMIVGAGLLTACAALATVAGLPQHPSVARRLRLAAAVCSVAVTVAYRGPVADATGWWWLLETCALLALLVSEVRGSGGRSRSSTLVPAVLQALAVVLLPVRIGPQLAPPADPAETGVLCLAWALLTAGAAASGGYLRGLDSRRRKALAAQRRQQRLEVARDLHDFASHDVMGVVVLVQAARVLAQEDPAQAVELLPRIEDAGMQALAAMDRTVHMLNEEGGKDGHRTEGGEDAPRARCPLPDPPRTADPTSTPAPSRERPRDLSQLDELAARFTRTGTVAARLHVGTGALDEVPGEVGALGYRTVVESLTNVRRHAPAATTVTIDVRRGPHHSGEALHLTVTDHSDRTSTPQRPAPLPERPRSGTGLAALTERAHALGGVLAAGPHGPAGWQVTVVLPLPRITTRKAAGPHQETGPAPEGSAA